ncbi:MAG TPA: MoaD/ThiS family protein [Candidatus Elarobacter sp.]|nr:MoaD/ThiS family protein [Candidatus Elarobacter sp.]
MAAHTGAGAAAAATVTVRVLAFARLRELLGFGERAVGVPGGATVETLWSVLAEQAPALAGLRASTRFARNGALADATTVLHEGDEIALLPPVGGG